MADQLSIATEKCLNYGDYVIPRNDRKQTLIAFKKSIINRIEMHGSFRLRTSGTKIKEFLQWKSENILYNNIQ